MEMPRDIVKYSTGARCRVVGPGHETRDTLAGTLAMLATRATKAATMPATAAAIAGRRGAMFANGTNRKCQNASAMSALGVPAQPVDATQALNFSSGVSNPRYMHGR